MVLVHRRLGQPLVEPVPVGLVEPGGVELFQLEVAEQRPDPMVDLPPVLLERPGLLLRPAQFEPLVEELANGDAPPAHVVRIDLLHECPERLGRSALGAHEGLRPPNLLSADEIVATEHPKFPVSSGPLPHGSRSILAGLGCHAPHVVPCGAFVEHAPAGPGSAVQICGLNWVFMWTFGDGFQTLPRRWKQYLNRGYLANQPPAESPRRPHIGPRTAREPPVQKIRDGIQTPAPERSGPTKPVQRRLTHSELEVVAAAYQHGRSLDELAREFGIHHRTVADHLERLGIARRVNLPKLSAADVKRAAARYRNGESLATVGKALKVDASSVQRALKRVGVPIRPRPGC